MYRWVLKNHLYNVHSYYEKDAEDVAIRSEYWLNPHYVRRPREDEE
jgi:hypothetical protein